MNCTRGWDHIGAPGLLLDRDLVLSDFDDPSKKAWPPYEVPLAVQVAQAMRGY